VPSGRPHFFTADCDGAGRPALRCRGGRNGPSPPPGNRRRRPRRCHRPRPRRRAGSCWRRTRRPGRSAMWRWRMIGARQRACGPAGRGPSRASMKPPSRTTPREHAKLADRAAALALDTPARQAAFGDGAFDQLVADAEDVGGDRLEEDGARFEAGVAIGAESLGRERARFGHVAGRGAAEGRRHHVVVRRIDSVQRLGCARAARAGNDHVTVKHGIPQNGDESYTVDGPISPDGPVGQGKAGICRPTLRRSASRGHALSLFCLIRANAATA
jgi:hypothetical protein